MIGSINDAKKAPVENMASAIEIFATSMAPKNVIQCKAIITPAMENLRISFEEAFSFTLAILIYPSIKIAAITMRNQTNGTAFIEISSPKIAVNPAMNTKKCKCK